MLVHCTPGTLATLRVGEHGRLATSLIVREESLTLYGFATDDERTVFGLVQTASGVGPKLALAMLAVHTPNSLRVAVASADLKALTRIPGIGQKGAQRIVLELKDKLGTPEEAVNAALNGHAAKPLWREQVHSGPWSGSATPPETPTRRSRWWSRRPTPRWWRAGSRRSPCCSRRRCGC
ncbi:hypothetical protein GCM10020219_018010 [Nonomuraea dietziae]